MNLELVSSTELRIGDHSLSTKQVEKLINQLVMARVKMQPPIPGDIRQWDGDVVPQPDPPIEIGRLETGNEILMMIRHQGFGWVCFSLSQRLASIVRDALSKRTAGNGITLTEEDAPNGNFLKH